MVGYLSGKAYRTSCLNRFGYVNLQESHPVLGEELGVLPAHEFHYFDSENCGEDFLAKKPASVRNWKCIHADERRILGFPHLYYYGCPQVAAAFLRQCEKKETKRWQD